MMPHWERRKPGTKVRRPGWVICMCPLMAPRALLLQTGNTDCWSDPKGEFLSVIAAAPVYALFAEKGPANSPIPAARDTSFLMNRLGYYMHDGGHTVLPEDWTYFIRHMKKHL